MTVNCSSILSCGIKKENSSEAVSSTEISVKFLPFKLRIVIELALLMGTFDTKVVRIQFLRCRLSSLMPFWFSTAPPDSVVGAVALVVIVSIVLTASPFFAIGMAKGCCCRILAV